MTKRSSSEAAWMAVRLHRNAGRGAVTHRPENDGAFFVYTEQKAIFRAEFNVPYPI